MATGRLGHADLTGGANTSLYTVPNNSLLRYLYVIEEMRRFR